MNIAYTQWRQYKREWSGVVIINTGDELVTFDEDAAKLASVLNVQIDHTYNPYTEERYKTLYVERGTIKNIKGCGNILIIHHS